MNSIVQELRKDGQRTLNIEAADEIERLIRERDNARALAFEALEREGLVESEVEINPKHAWLMDDERAKDLVEVADGKYVKSIERLRKP